MLLMKAFQALKAGEELSNPKTAKTVTVIANLLIPILAFIVALVRIKYPELMVSDEALTKIAIGISTILGIFNGWSTVATSKTIGVKNGKV